MEEGKPLMLAYSRGSTSRVGRWVVFGVVLAGVLLLAVSEGYTRTAASVRNNIMSKPAEMQGAHERAWVDWCEKVGRLFR